MLKYKDSRYFDPEEAYKEKQGYIPERIIARGDVNCLKKIPFTFRGKPKPVAGNFYLEAKCLQFNENSRIILHTAIKAL